MYQYPIHDLAVLMYLRFPRKDLGAWLVALEHDGEVVIVEREEDPWSREVVLVLTAPFFPPQWHGAAVGLKTTWNGRTRMYTFKWEATLDDGRPDTSESIERPKFFAPAKEGGIHGAD